MCPCFIRSECTNNPLGLNYIPTEEERRIFRECGNESFWYRSLPFSVVGMAVTQGLISRGKFPVNHKTWLSITSQSGNNVGMLLHWVAGFHL
ncbi:hypothetical protein JZ751_019918 [Albula glossodonta]|uniref:OCIA domain-containing protein 1 n=1 Tax=Albula glossodonta TaxID=121402 RepID=A0A8T2MSV9_9TELE|nr:hypothetical protein JZ751_019918 [Albula glossodonta]